MVISNVLNPLILPPILFAIILWEAGVSGPEIGVASALSLTLFTFAPLSYILWLYRRGEVDSIEIRSRSRRFRPLAVSIFFYGVALITFAYWPLPGSTIVAWLCACFILNTAVVMGITAFWKISIHTMSIAGVCGVLLFLLVNGYAVRSATWTWALLSGLAVPVMMWARVRLRAHTGAQVIGGALFGMILPYLELALLHRYGLLSML